MTEREPREKPVRVSQQQTVYGEVAANSDQPVFLTQMRIREPEIFI